jgi:hypothetical protein
MSEANDNEDEFQREDEAADILFDALLEETPDDTDIGGVAFSLWVKLTYFLALDGWTPDQLIEDIHHHMALATSEGGMN